jgi:recombination protein RecA
MKKKATEEMAQTIEADAAFTRNKGQVPETEATEDTPQILIPAGCVVLNLACSDRADGAYAPGSMVNLIGDSSAGKTYIALTMGADIAHNPLFDDYRIIFDDVEQANEFDMERLFGTKLAERIEPPRYEEDGETPLYSDTIQDFHVAVDDAFKDGRPFIYILDSLDALTSREEQKVVKENLDKLRKGNLPDGSYGMDKPKALSQFLRLIVARLKKTKSFILVISQTRDNISPLSFAQKTRSGGRALKFYCSHEIWLAEGNRELKRERAIGKIVHAKITKNKITGKVREVFFPIYNEYGVDNIGACLNLLCHENVWKSSVKPGTWVGGSVISGFDTFLGTDKCTQKGTDKCTRDKFIREVTAQNKHQELVAFTEKTWQEIEASLSLDRPPKYPVAPAVTLSDVPPAPAAAVEAPPEAKAD